MFSEWSISDWTRHGGRQLQPERPRSAEAVAWIEVLEPRVVLSINPIVDAGTQVGTTQQFSEISGLAVSRSLPGNLWVQQDSGDQARFYGISTSGTVHSTITLSGITAVDWEDMAIGPKPGGGNYLYIGDIGDIGDNGANRTLGVDIIRVTEPAATGNATLTAADYKVKRVTYPGIPFLNEEDAESLFVDPLTSDIYIIQKLNPGRLFRLPADQFDVAGSYTLQSLGNINAPLNKPTSADISPDGRFIVVRNSSNGGATAYVFERGPGQTVQQALQGTPSAHTLRTEPQGEAIGWNQDGSGFFSISEGTTRPIWFYNFDASPLNVSAGGPYAINEGASLTLTASAVAPGPLLYSWDVNGDGVYGDATGSNPTLSWAQLQTLGVNDGAAAFQVRVAVDNGAHPPVISSATTLSVANTPPTAALSLVGDAAVRGAPSKFVLTATDPSWADQNGNFTWQIDWNGDQLFDETVVGPSGAGVTHIYATTGAYGARVRATDKDGGVGSISTTTVTVQPWAVTLNSATGLTDLVWGGGSGLNVVLFLGGGGTTISSFELIVDGTYRNSVNTYSGVTGKVRAYGQASDDLLWAIALFGKSVEFYGAGGNDRLIGSPQNDLLDGGDGDDFLWGHLGDDSLTGGAGNDLLFGYLGADTLNGGAGSDLLLAGEVFFPPLQTNDLFLIQAEWNSNRSIANRVANISGAGSGPRNNENFYLQPGVTVADDAAIDVVLGGDDEDWILYGAGSDLAPDLQPGVDVTTNLIS